MKTISFIFLLLTITGTISCNRFCRSEMPGQTLIGFEIRKIGKAVPVSELKGAKLFWIGNDGVKEYEGDGFRIDYPQRQTYSDPVDSTKPLLRSTIAASMSSAGTAKEFYIEYADKSVDTLLIDYQPVTTEENHCKYTNIVFKEIKYRGVNAPVDSSLLNQYQFYPVYILNK